ncbi:hypothetical protein [Nioella ostreopsis]|uniref:hypothetical protein n=1 Tax=Nioella ostreopsis TaxID=2448479 RepID=UPI000FD751E2|nr:hypothetical protein [Nioella ostreopsis]
MTLFLPPAAAWLCPACYGFERIAPSVYLERDASEAETSRMLDMIGAAQARVETVLGPLQAEPDILICHSAQCDARLDGRGAWARAFGAVFILVSPPGRNVEILSHELAHIAIHRRIGPWAQMQNALPAWFDEGLAVILSRDMRYLTEAEDGTLGCLISSDGSLPELARDWRRRAGEEFATLYPMAACEVLGWLESYGGMDAVGPALALVRSGAPFPATE